MRILLTGHMGFIGSQLYETLRKEYTVYGIDLKDGKDILTCSLDYSVDLVIHLAGKSGVRDSMKTPGPYWHVNVEGSKRIFEYFGKKGVRVIYASSSSAYEPTLNPYAASKYLLEKMAEKYNNFLGLRLHTVYSDTPRKGMFFDKLLNGTLEYVTPHKRDFIHLDDVCDAIKLCVDDAELTGIVDIGTGTSVRIQELAPNLPVHLNTMHERSCTKANVATLTYKGFKPKYTVKNFLTSKGFESKL